jgi:hypothetical protein
MVPTKIRVFGTENAWLAAVPEINRLEKNKWIYEFVFTS